MAILAILGPFRAPWALPGTASRGCFYINPSRRGPVAPPEAPGSPGAPKGRGNPRRGCRGSPPEGA